MKKIKSEQHNVRSPVGQPNCPEHHVPMAYNSTNMRWECTLRLQENCKHVAFPPSIVEAGRPVLGRGDLEVMRVDDPEGLKSGRVLLRAAGNNVILDITDYLVTDVLTKKHGGAVVTLDLTHMSDTRTRD